MAYGACVSAPPRPDARGGPPAPGDEATGRDPLPWTGRGERTDWLIIGGIAVSGFLPLAMLPLVPVLVSSHPALLELLRGSTASIINMGARRGSARRRSPRPCCSPSRA